MGYHKVGNEKPNLLVRGERVVSSMIERILIPNHDLIGGA